MNKPTSTTDGNWVKGKRFKHVNCLIDISKDGIFCVDHDVEIKFDKDSLDHLERPTLGDKGKRDA